jgi:ribosomal protein S18 acetylase RimI-like enzyme
VTLPAGDGFVLRLFTEGDVPLLARWRSDLRIACWIGGPGDEEAIRAKYVANPARAHITHAIAERDGEPVGYVQWYPCQAEYLAAAGLTGEDDVWALDLYLAPEHHDSGLGSRLVRVVAGHLAATVARRVLIDPEAANARAVRAYEKAGFRVVRPLPSYSVREGVTRDNVLLEWQGDP